MLKILDVETEFTLENAVLSCISVETEGSRLLQYKVPYKNYHESLPRYVEDASAFHNNDKEPTLCPHCHSRLVKDNISSRLKDMYCVNTNCEPRHAAILDRQCELLGVIAPWNDPVFQDEVEKHPYPLMFFLTTPLSPYVDQSLWRDSVRKCTFSEICSIVGVPTPYVDKIRRAYEHLLPVDVMHAYIKETDDTLLINNPKVRETVRLAFGYNQDLINCLYWVVKSASAKSISNIYYSHVKKS